MTTVRLIPCLDIKDGRVVKGVRFVDLKDAGDPVELGVRYASEGADEICFLDITASHEGRAPVVDLATKVAERLFIPFTVGGGIRSVETIRECLRAGADKTAINTSAVENPQLISTAADRFGSQCVVVAIDAKRAGDGWRVYTHGGRRETELEAISWAMESARRGAGEILLTSMDRDGSRDGYDIELTRRVSEAVDIPVVASGGAGTAQHMVEVAKEGRADAVLLAGILHDGSHGIGDLKLAMRQAQLPIR